MVESSITPKLRGAWLALKIINGSFAPIPDIKMYAVCVEALRYNFGCRLQLAAYARENIKELVEEMPNIPQKETRRRELSFKASKKVLENAGILNTLSPSPTMVNIIQRDSPYIPLGAENFRCLCRQQP